MNKKVAELLQTIKWLYMDNPSQTYSIDSIKALIIEEVGFDVDRAVRHRMVYLKGKGIMVAVDRKERFFRLNGRALLAVLDQDVNLKKLVDELDEKEKSLSRAIVESELAQHKAAVVVKPKKSEKKVKR